MDHHVYKGICSICNGNIADETMTTDCCGRPLYDAELRAIQRKEMDYCNSRGFHMGAPEISLDTQNQE